MSDRNVTELATAVSDGDVIDWPRAFSCLTAENRLIAAQLKALSEVSHAPEARAASAAFDARRLPVLLEAVIFLSIAKTFAGLAAILLTSGLGGVDIRAIVALAFGGVALLLGLNRQDRRARALAGCYWTVAAAFASFGMTRIAAAGHVAVGWARAFDALRPESFLAAYLWQFAREFPIVTRFSRVDRLAHLALRTSIGLGLVLFIANVLPALNHRPAIDEWFTVLNRSRNNGLGFWAIVFGAALPALSVIPLRARDAISAERRRVRLFLCTIGLGLAPVATEVLLEMLFPGFTRFMDSPVSTRIGAWLIYPSLLSIPVLTGYAVTVHRVFSLPVRMGERLKRVLTHSLIKWATFGAFAMLITRLYQRREHPLSEVVAAPNVRVLAAGVLVGVALIVFRAPLMRAFQRWTLRADTGPSALLAELATRLRMTRTPGEVAVAFADVAARALQASSQPYVAWGDHRLEPMTTPGLEGPVASLIPILLDGAHKPCVVKRGRESYYPLLSRGDRQWIDEHDIAIVVPLAATRESAGLSAVVTVHGRDDGMAFSRDDVRFLTTASASASLALDGLVSEEADAHSASTELARQCSRCGSVEVWSSAGSACVCGGAWEIAGLPKILLRRFTIDALLGAGGMGLVYRGTDRVLNRAVAVKTLPRVSADAADRLMNEARAMAKLCHQHVAVLYGTERWNSTPVLIMEYLPGGTLEARLHSAALSVAETIQTGIALVDALKHVHRTGLYHGDIKPSNIGFTAEGAPKFLDFGLSRTLGELELLAGTVPYLSPEALRGGSVGPMLDLWALCVVLFECVTGVHPFLDGQRTRARIAGGLDEVVPSGRVRIPEPLVSFFDVTLARQPERRPQTAAHLLQELSALDVARA